MRRLAAPLAIQTTHSRLIFAFNIIFLVLAIVAVSLRIYARRLKRLSFLAEDYFVFAAMVSGYRSQRVPRPTRGSSGFLLKLF